jgi:DNA polymerase (family X)
VQPLAAGRQLRGFVGDVEKVLKACANHGVAVEINANPWRLDLDWRWHQRGLELGCIFSINPDAHSIAELDLMRWGLAMARKGGLNVGRILNALDLRSFSHWLERRRIHSAPEKAGFRRGRYSADPARPPATRRGKFVAIQPMWQKRSARRTQSA